VVNQPLLSIIITFYTLNRLKDITELLDSIKAQTYPNIEIILVAERSIELYEHVKVHILEKAILNAKIIFNNGEQGASAGRNMGIKIAKGDIIAFVDDDTLLFPDWAREMIKTYQDKSIIGVAGSCEPLWEDKSMNWFPQELYWILGCTNWSGWNEKDEVRSGAGANMSFRREGLEANEFLTALGPKRHEDKSWTQGLAEDAELSVRIRRKTGKPIIYNPKVKLMHRVYKYRLSLKYIIERSYQVGCSRHMLRKLYTQENKGTSILNPEYDLLRRIFFRLFPNILKVSFKEPINAWRKFRVTFIALFFVTLGYVFYFRKDNLSIKEKV
jgi:glycosyltransferase involved in cell wall biosynthesis